MNSTEPSAESEDADMVFPSVQVEMSLQTVLSLSFPANFLLLALGEGISFRLKNLIGDTGKQGTGN